MIGELKAVEGSAAPGHRKKQMSICCWLHINESDDFSNTSAYGEAQSLYFFGGENFDPQVHRTL
jgi:hypothetical protein